MKKKATILLMGLLTVAIFNGCGNKDTSKDISVVDTAVTETQSEQECETVSEAQEEVSTEDDTQGFVLSGYKFRSEKNGFYIVSIEGLPFYGMVNAKGDFVIPAEYDEMEFAQNGNVLLELEGKWGVFDTEGKEVLPFEYEEISAGINNYYVKKDGMPMVIDSKGNVVKELDAEIISYDKMVGDLYLHGVALAEKIYGWGSGYANVFCDLNGDKVQWVECFYNTQLYRVYKGDLDNGNWETIDIIDENGDLLYELTNKKDEESYTVHVLNSTKVCSLEKIDFGVASQDVASTGSGEYYLYNMEKQERSEQKYSRIGSLGDGKIYGKKEGGIDIFDTDGNLINSFELTGYDDFSKVGEMFVVQYGQTYRVYNENGEELTGERYLNYSNNYVGRAFIKVQNLSGQWGVLDKNGKQILPFGSVDDYSWYHGSEIIKDGTVDDKWYILTEEVDGTLRLNIIDYNNL